MAPRWGSHPICMTTRIGSCFYPEACKFTFKQMQGGIHGGSGYLVCHSAAIQP